MNYEQKYNEALERAEAIYTGKYKPEIAVFAKKSLETIFPELEAYEDERRRKAIHIYLDWLDGRKDCAPRGEYSIRDMIAWLDKQEKFDDEENAKVFLLSKGYPISANGDIPTYKEIFEIIKDGIEYQQKQGEKESEDEIIPDKNETRDIEQNLAGNDEKIRKAIICGMYALKEQHRRYFASIHIDDVITWLEKQGTSYTTKDVDDAYLKGINDAKHEIEKQYKADYQIMKEIAEFIYNSVFKPKDLKKKEKWLTWFNKQGKKMQGKSALDAVKEERVDNANKNISKFKAEDWYVSKVDGKIHNIYHSDKVEQKFKIGDWVVGEISVYKIISLNDELNCYMAINLNNEEVKIPYYFDDAQGHMCSYHLWSIEDAKDGDVLASGQVVFMFKMIHGVWLNCYCSLHNDGSFIADSYDLLTDKYFSEVHPATKEQRNTLFARMREAGYEWDSEKKELKVAIIESKFKIGDWVVFNDHHEGIYQIEKIENFQYTLRHILGGSMPLSFSHEDMIRLWTIKDIKDGDVISNGEMIVIFKHWEEPSYRQRIIAYIGLDINGDIQITDGDWSLGIDKAKPATKEQRDTLFVKMKEEGYEWDANKKEIN